MPAEDNHFQDNEMNGKPKAVEQSCLQDDEMSGKPMPVEESCLQDTEMTGKPEPVVAIEVGEEESHQVFSKKVEQREEKILHDPEVSGDLKRLEAAISVDQPEPDRSTGRKEVMQANQLPELVVGRRLEPVETMDMDQEHDHPFAKSTKLVGEESQQQEKGDTRPCGNKEVLTSECTLKELAELGPEQNLVDQNNGVAETVNELLLPLDTPQLERSNDNLALDAVFMTDRQHSVLVGPAKNVVVKTDPSVAPIHSSDMGSTDVVSI